MYLNHLSNFALLEILFVCISIGTILVSTKRDFSRNGFTKRQESGEIDVWVLYGGLKSDEVTFQIRQASKLTSDARTLQFYVIKSMGSSGEEIVDSTSLDLSSNNPIFSIRVTNLQPNQSYSYGVTSNIHAISLPHFLDLIGDLPTYGSFRTPAPEGNRYDFTIAVSGCALTGSNAQVFRHIVSDDKNNRNDDLPLLFLHAGDFHYEDLNTINLEERIQAIDMVMNSPSQRDLFANVAFVYMWDDHDWLGNDSLGGLESLEREVALISYQMVFPYYQPLPASLLGDNSANHNNLLLQSQSKPSSAFPPYHAFTIGTVRFIVTDLRSESTSSQIYSGKQRSWFFDELRNSTNYDYVVWLNSKPWIGPAEDNDDSWLGYSDDRRDLSNHISKVVTKGNLLVVSADAHMVAFDDGRNTYYGDKNDDLETNLSFPLLQSGPLDKLGSIKGGPYSHGCHTVEFERNHQYSTVSFQFPKSQAGNSKIEDSETACIHIKSYSIRNEFVRKENRLLLSEKICGSLFRHVPMEVVNDEKDSTDNVPILFLGASCKSRVMTLDTLVLLCTSAVFFICTLGMLYRTRKRMIVVTTDKSNKKCDDAILASLLFFISNVLIVLSTALPITLSISSLELTLGFTILCLQCIVSFLYGLLWWWKTPSEINMNAQNNISLEEENDIAIDSN